MPRAEMLQSRNPLPSRKHRPSAQALDRVRHPRGQRSGPITQTGLSTGREVQRTRTRPQDWLPKPSPRPSPAPTAASARGRSCAPRVGCQSHRLAPGLISPTHGTGEMPALHGCREVNESLLVYVLQNNTAAEAQSAITGSIFTTVRGYTELHLQMLLRRIGVAIIILKAELAAGSSRGWTWASGTASTGHQQSRHRQQWIQRKGTRMKSLHHKSLP